MNSAFKSSLILSVACAVATVSGFSQLSAPSPTVVRDPASIQLLTQAIALSGGVTSWRSIRSARVTGTVTALSPSGSGTSSATKPIEWVDDWSADRPRYTRSITTPGGTHTMRHSDTSSSAVAVKGKQITVRPFDRTTVLLTHVPAAALTIILSDDSYAIQGDPNLSTSVDTAIDVTKADRSAIQVWLVSKTTGQVDAVRFTVPNPTNSTHQPWETAVYTHYRIESGLSRPDEVTLIRPTGQSIHFHFDAMEKNAPVSAGNFTLGAGK